MRKYLRVMGLSFSSSIFIVLIGLVTTVGGSSPAQAQDDVCEGLEGDAYDLCDAYCNAKKCGTDQQKGSDRGCDRVHANFMKATGGDDPPCHPCDICPCKFFDSLTTEFGACWGTTVTLQFLSPWSCTVDIGVNCCLLRIDQTQLPTIAVADLPGPTMWCNARTPTDVPGCMPIPQTPINENELTACRMCLALYSQALEDAGYDVTNGPPFMCTP